jgi:hypothetical protein
MQQIITLLGRDTGLKIVPNNAKDKYGVVNGDMDLILPFEYDYIDALTIEGWLLVKQNDKKILIEI